MCIKLHKLSLQIKNALTIFFRIVRATPHFSYQIFLNSPFYTTQKSKP